MTCAALRDTRSEGKTCAIGKGIGHLPATQDQVHSSARVAHEPLAFSDGQLVNRVGHEHLIAIERVRSPENFLVYGIVIGVINVCVRKSVVREELQAVANALFGLDLQSIVFVVGVIAVIRSIDSAAGRSLMWYAQCVRESKSRIRERRHTVQEVSSAIRRRLCGSKSTQFARRPYRIAGYRIDPRPDGDLVVVIGWALAGEHMSALIADIARGDVQRRSNLPLNCCIPLINGGQPLNQRTCAGLVSRRRPFIGKVPADEMLPSTGEVKGCGPCESVKIALRLFDAPVLKLVSDRSCRASTGRFWVTTWPKFEPNTPDVEAATVTHAYNGLRIELVSDAHARRQGLISICHVAVRADATVAGDSYQAVIQIQQNHHCPWR